MHKYYLIMLWPVGFGSANKVMHEVYAETRLQAIEEIKLLFPHLLLDDDGYNKIDSISYCVGEAYSFT
jgi:hypothetical protein